MPDRDNQSDPGNPYSGAYSGPGTGAGDAYGGGDWGLAGGAERRRREREEGSAPQTGGGGGGDGGGGGGGGAGPVGPQKAGSPIAAAVAATPSIFDGYSGPEIDEAKNLVKSYMHLIGYPPGVDAEQMALHLLRGGLENRSGDAFQDLYYSSFTSDDIRQANPWARYGMDADGFKQTEAGAKIMLHNMLGMDVNLSNKKDGDPLDQLLQNIIKNGWGQSQVMTYLQSGQFTNEFGGTGKVDLSTITGAQPWLAVGVSYQQEAQQYINMYGAPPVDTPTLGAWFRFNEGAAHIGGGVGVSTRAVKTPTQVEVR